MDETLTQLMLEHRRIAYAITDCQLHVIESGGATTCYQDYQTWRGLSLLELVPELVGSEEILAGMLAGQVPRHELAWVNRETADGQTIYLTMVELPHRDPAGEIVGLVHLVQDATEMGRLEQEINQHRNELRLLRDQLTQKNLELEVANAELRRLDELKSQFVSVAAHELRTPLSSVVGYVELLLDEDFGPLNLRQREFVETLQESGRRLMDLTRDLLDVTRIETGRVDLVLHPTDLGALVQDVATEFRPQLESKAQRLTLRLPPDLPDALCDQARTRQIIRNLLSNASKYTPEVGQIAIAVALAEESGYMQVSVMDNGVGIPAEDRDKVFSRFFRAGSASMTGANGAGLGLHITRSLVELHGGRIWFESQLDAGSTFHVTFPVVDSPA